LAQAAIALGAELMFGRMVRLSRRAGMFLAELEIFCELVWQVAVSDCVRDGLDVVRHARELDGISSSWLKDRVTRTPIAVFRLANGSNVHEQHIVDVLRVRLVRMTEDNHVGIRHRGESLKARHRPIFEQVFV
jgi:hypothetical protein